MRTHGLDSTYNDPRSACRCRKCRDAHAAVQRLRRIERARLLASGEVVKPHGSYSTYTNWGCRCEDCSAAARDQWESYKARAG